jgi:hypothetical protein
MRRNTCLKKPFLTLSRPVRANFFWPSTLLRHQTQWGSQTWSQRQTRQFGPIVQIWTTRSDHSEYIRVCHASNSCRFVSTACQIFVDPCLPHQIFVNLCLPHVKFFSIRVCSASRTSIRVYATSRTRTFKDNFLCCYSS